MHTQNFKAKGERANQSLSYPTRRDGIGCGSHWSSVPKTQEKLYMYHRQFNFKTVFNK